METQKRLIYMDDTMDKLMAYAERKHQAGHTEIANGILKAVNYIHNEISRVDAMELPDGRPGDYIIWDNGVFRAPYYINSVVICKSGCVRYDLGAMCPVVNHKSIIRILTPEEAEEEMAKGNFGIEMQTEQ